MMRYLLLLAVAVAAHGQFGAATSVVSGNGAPIAAQCTNANNVGRVWARKDGGAASTTFYICAATGAGTYGWQLNDGAIGGAGNIASGQVLYGTAAGVAGSEAAFTYTGTTAKTTTITGSASSKILAVGGNRTLELSAFNGDAAYVNALGGAMNLGTANAFPVNFVVGNSAVARFAATTGNLLLGTTTDDGTNRLQVAGSVAVGGAVANNTITVTRTGPNPSSLQVGAFTDKPTFTFSGSVALAFEVSGGSRLASLSTAGTFQVYNETPTTGVTQLIVRAGAGQSTTNLTTWQNAAGTEIASLSSAGTFSTAASVSSTNAWWLLDANGLVQRSAGLLRWSSTTSFSGASDLSLSRAGINVLQVGDGGANANGIVSAAGYRMALTTPASASATGTTGTIVWDADYVYVCTATNTWKRVAIATW